MKFIDGLLNKITMYKLVLYGLLILALIAIIFGFLGILPYSGLSLIYSFLLLTGVCYISNYLFAKLLNAQRNIESFWITATILFFLLLPLTSFGEVWMYVLVSVLAMGSKYILAFRKKHIFNPTAISVFIIGLFGSSIVFWWVGSSVMIIPVGILGFLVLRKVQRFQLFFSFLIASTITIILVSLNSSVSIYETLTSSFLSGPILFFGAIMLTEPMTTPPKNNLRIIYGVFVGVLYGLQFQIGPLYTTPELALILGNIFSYIVSPKDRLVLTLFQRNRLSFDIYDFIWKPNRKINWKAGQYLEWTLPHRSVDIRGNRRYFTIASSPTEDTINLGVKFYDNSSSFKKRLLSMEIGQQITASQLSGEFTLPKDSKKKLVFIAGGIGVTPFRSMIKFLFDKGEKRDIVLFFSNKTPVDIVYKKLFDEAKDKIGLKTVYVVGGLAGAPPPENTQIGLINDAMIMKEVPDYKERMFYISGPRGMVDAFKKTLVEMGVKRSEIKSDFFPGYV